MPLAHWDPVRELLALQERMSRLIDHAVSGRQAASDPLRGGTWSPLVDLYESDSHVIMKAEIPGVEHDAIQLSIDRNRITLRGERCLSEPETKTQFHRTERAFGPFTRSFTLPGNVDPDGVKAEFKRGVLVVSIPKRVDEQSKQVPITS